MSDPMDAAVEATVLEWETRVNTNMKADASEHVKALLEAARPLMPEAQALARVRALHVPHWTDNNGIRHENWVGLYGDDLPDDHRCHLTRDGSGVFEEICYPDGGEHVALACYECRTATEEGEPGYLLGPCATRAAIEGPS
jgi:hypothetical protein